MSVDLTNTVDGEAERFVPEAMEGQLVEAEHFGRYWWVRRLAAGRRVLDAGCGVGYGSQILHDAGAEDVVAVDISPEVVEAARTRVSPEITVEQGDLHRLRLPDGRFDLVVAFEVIEHVPDPEAVIRELARVLAWGGILVVSTPNAAAGLGTNVHHVRELSPDELRSALEEHFQHVRLVRQESWLTSAIMDDDEFRARGVRLEGAEAHKVHAAVLGREVYTIGLASNVEIPPVPATVVLTRAAEIRNLLDHVQLLERRLSDQAFALREAGALDQHADRLRERLQEAERVVAELHGLQGGRSRTEELERELRHTTAVLDSVLRSRSWRMFAPARALAAVVRQSRNG
jgi:2-polyprenyl-3-methyl-5-hydroxy-6-metoxy-1,4-benzoquinol methylase